MPLRLHYVPALYRSIDVPCLWHLVVSDAVLLRSGMFGARECRVGVLTKVIMPEFTQEGRLIAIETPLGPDKLLLRSFTMHEELGRPFVCECEIRSVEPNLDYDKIIGSPAAIRIELDNTTRYINGIVSRFGHTGTIGPGRMNHFVMTIVPSMWFLSRTSTCRIFQNMSVPDIIKQVLNDYGTTDISITLKGTFKPREYVVQYRESALDFISRLMEEEGIYYYFAHESGKHTMVIVDDLSAHKPVEGGAATVPFLEHEHFDGGEEAVSSVERSQVVMTGAVTLRDFDFRNPTRLLESERKTVVQQHPLKTFEHYDYPGRYDMKEGGDRYALLRMDQYECRYESLRFESSAKHLVVGHKFTLSQYPVAALNKEYIITAAQQHADGGEFGSNVQHGKGPSYTVSFKGILANLQFRSEMLTPKPRIVGPQTAFVVGASGEEIFPDEFGRVKVQFLWDREGKSDEKSSCYIRVSQGWAGARFGMMFLPRIGQEVIVEFLEGDPDRPIITGRVYNGGEGQVPYKLPDNKTVSTIKSSSSKGGEGFNEIRFEDKSGKEFIFVHAQKDYHRRVINDSLTFIGHDQDRIVKNDAREEIGNDRHELVKRDHNEQIGRDRNKLIKGKEAIEVVGAHSEKVGGDVIEQYDAKQSTKVKDDLYIKAKNICIEADTNITIKVGGTYIAIEADSQKLEATSKIEIKTGTETAIDAGTEFKVKSVTGASIKASAGDFKAEGLNAGVKGSIGAKMEGGVTADVKAAIASVEGSGMAKLKGAITMIN